MIVVHGTCGASRVTATGPPATEVDPVQQSCELFSSRASSTTDFLKRGRGAIAYRARGWNSPLSSRKRSSVMLSLC